MPQQKANILWLDDHFDEHGESAFARSDGDLMLSSDYSRVEMSFDNISLTIARNIERFVQFLTDHERLCRGLPSIASRPRKFDALIVDIAIDGTPSATVPRMMDGEMNGIDLHTDGQVKEWIRINSSANGFNMGLLVAQHYFSNSKAFEDVSLLLYTFRPINSEIDDVVEDMRKHGAKVHASQKLDGIASVVRHLKSIGIQ